MIKTDRLLLRPFEPDDLELICRIYSDEEILRYTPFDPMDEEQAARHLTRVLRDWRQNPCLSQEFAVCLRERDAKIGRAHVLIDPETDTGMIGMFLLQDAQGQGYGTEITKALIRYCFEELHLHRVNAVLSPENTASRKMLEKCGLRREALMLQKCRYVKKGVATWHDELEYAMLAGEAAAISSAAGRPAGSNGHILENGKLKITIADHGAELCSVYDKQAARERLWNADPAVWNRHAPILFPFVGKVMNGRYRVDGKEYAMKTQHGFARDMDFTCIEETDGSVTHQLVSSDETRERYPFDFRLTVRHSLTPERPGELKIDWKIENLGSSRMFYAIGGHPAFMPPEGVGKEQCRIFFPGRETLSFFSADPAGYALPQMTHMLYLDRGYASWQDSIPDTWIFEDQGIGCVGLSGPDRKPFVLVHCDEFPILAVWANPKGPFLCLEPWFGRTDDEGFSGGLEEKPGLQSLEAHGSKEISWSIDFCV